MAERERNANEKAADAAKGAAETASDATRNAVDADAAEAFARRTGNAAADAGSFEDEEE